MTKTPISLQDLRRTIYVKAKAEPTWRFWGLYVHVCKMETLHEAYRVAKQNNGAPGIDGVTFAAIEAGGVADHVAPRVRCPEFHQVLIVDGDHIWQNNDRAYFPEWLREVSNAIIRPIEFSDELVSRFTAPN